MSQQGQPQRPVGHDEPTKYGDVFQVSGELASKPVVPRDAAAVKAAELKALGWNPRGSAATAMESAADRNDKAGLLAGSADATHIGGEQGVKISETFFSGNRVVKESLAGQVVQHIAEPQMVRSFTGGVVLDNNPITVGEALEATAFSAPNKAVDQSDVAAIQAAEARATGINVIRAGDVAAAARTAAEINVKATHEDDEDSDTLYDVLVNARSRMVADKVVTREDAERVTDAEVRDKPFTGPTHGGVAASIAAAAQINQADNK